MTVNIYRQHGNLQLYIELQLTIVRRMTVNNYMSHGSEQLYVA